MPGSNAEFAQKTQTYWNNRNSTHAPSRWLFWYQHPQALAHYRRLVSPIQAPVWRKPLHCYLTEHYPQRRFERGLSIGCGAAYKELLLLDDDVVGVFDLFELSDAVLAAGCRAAAEAGLAARARGSILRTSSGARRHPRASTTSSTGTTRSTICSRSTRPSHSPLGH